MHWRWSSSIGDDRIGRKWYEAALERIRIQRVQEKRFVGPTIESADAVGRLLAK